MNKLPILYSFRRCPYAMRARIFIKLCNIKVELREVLLKDIPKEMIDVSPKATVPVLKLSDGKILEESLDIINWAIDINDIHGLKTSKTQNIKINKDILFKFDEYFKYHLDRYKYNSRYEGNKDVKSKNEHRNEALKILSTIEKKLSDNTLWIFGNEASYLDLAILPFVRQYRIADISWFDEKMPLRKVHAWLIRFLEWNTFNQIMIKNKPWRNEDQPIFFGHD